MKLEKCLFCQDEENEVHVCNNAQHADGAWWIQCECGAESGTYQTESEACDNWNRVMS